MAPSDRVEALTRHFTSAMDLGDARNLLALPDFCPVMLNKFLIRDNFELRQRILSFLKDDIYQPQYYLSLMDFRDLTLKRLQKYVQQRFFSVEDYINDPQRFWAGLEQLLLVDYSMCIKAGVHFTLCGGTIAKLGTEKHRRAYLPRIDSLDLPGCFGMTELAYGSNVMGIQTTATYDASTQEFVINTPNNMASKYWIGGAAQHGKVCTVFAQLTINGKWEGPHVFVVRIRDDQSNIMPGVRIKDCGAKSGLNGVDNGQIWFDNVRVPRDALLNAFSDVLPDGTYTSKIPTVSARFGTMVSGLTTGRILIASGAVYAMMQAMIIATRYSCHRPQFGGKMIMSYLTQQRRLVPSLATVYAYHFGMLELKALAQKRRPEDAKMVHILSSGLKAGATWSRVEVHQLCRECTGGMGFLAANKIGVLKNDMDVDVTFEGDNTVMMQQVAKAVLDAAASAPPPQLSIPSFGTCLNGIQSLLAFREQMLLLEVMKPMAAAMKSASPQNRAAAVEQAYEANMDRAVQLGWAYVDNMTFKAFVREAAVAPAASQPALQALARVYGLTRIERNMACYLAAGAMNGQQAGELREAVNTALAQLTANNGKTLLLLCDGFGIPEHLLPAPIAHDWRLIGSDIDGY